MAPRRPRIPLYASGINDFRPGLDYVERIDGKAHVVSRDNTYAPIAVHEPTIEAFNENVAKLSPEQRAKMLAVVLRTPFLSPEGRAERVRSLLASGVPLRFDVVPDRSCYARRHGEQRTLRTVPWSGLGKQLHTGLEAAAATDRQAAGAGLRPGRRRAAVHAAEPGARGHHDPAGRSGPGEERVT